MRWLGLSLLLVPSAAACIPLHLIVGQFRVPEVDAETHRLDHVLFETFTSVVDFRRRLFEEMKE